MKKNAQPGRHHTQPTPVLGASRAQNCTRPGPEQANLDWSGPSLGQTPDCAQALTTPHLEFSGWGLGPV